MFKIFIFIFLLALQLDAVVWSLTDMSFVVTMVNTDVSKNMNYLKQEISNMNTVYDNNVKPQNKLKNKILTGIAELKKEILITTKEINFEENLIVKNNSLRSKK